MSAKKFKASVTLVPDEGRGKLLPCTAFDSESPGLTTAGYESESNSRLCLGHLLPSELLEKWGSATQKTSAEFLCIAEKA